MISNNMKALYIHKREKPRTLALLISQFVALTLTSKVVKSPSQFVTFSNSTTLLVYMKEKNIYIYFEGR